MQEEKIIAQWTWREMLKLTFDVLNYQLFELDGHGVSLGKLITGLVMLIVGYWISGRGAKAVDRRVLGRMSIDEHLRYTLRRFIFYFFLCLSTLFTLHTLAVPVTIFTVLGGALAVGIGFGSQNLVNNFISGILVMIERPFRVGDFIDVEGVSGQVESIGIRSTVMRTGVNAILILPNTRFIEKNLINWTLSETVSCSVRFSVVYGTDVEVLRRLCQSVITDVPEVVKNQPATLTFVDFGENGLVFDLGYVIHASFYPSRSGIDGGMRTRLYEVLRENKVEFPSPRRDFRLHGGEFIPVKVLN